MGSRVEKKSALEYRKTSRQGSSVVEQGTHKPLVGSSTLPPGTLSLMASAYIWKGSSGRHYYGISVDLDARFAQHLRGHTATTKRLGDQLEILATKEVQTVKK